MRMTPRERARKVAEIIMGDSNFLRAAWVRADRKQLEGLAELIDDGMRETLGEPCDVCGGTGKQPPGEGATMEPKGM